MDRGPDLVQVHIISELGRWAHGFSLTYHSHTRVGGISGGFCWLFLAFFSAFFFSFSSNGSGLVRHISPDLKILGLLQGAALFPWLLG